MFGQYPIQILKANTLGIWVALGIAKKHNARFLYTYGPRMRAEGVYGRVIPRFIEQALSNTHITIFGDGSQTRSFCYVTDQVEGLLKHTFSFVKRKPVLKEKIERGNEEERGEVGGEVVNIGSDKEITILELANLIRGLAKSDSEIVFEELPEDDPPRRKPDITKANKILGWEPKVELGEGLSKMIKWFEEKGKGELT